MAQPRVKMSIGYTKNLGNFESLRVDVGVEVDCRENESPSDTFERISHSLEKELVYRTQKMLSELDG